MRVHGTVLIAGVTALLSTCPMKHSTEHSMEHSMERSIEHSIEHEIRTPVLGGRTALQNNASRERPGSPAIHVC